MTAPPQVRFPTTQWETLNDLQRMSPQERREALGEFLERYQPAMLAYVMRFFRPIQEADAADLVQDFMADKVLSRGLIAGASQERGKLRRYLQVAIRNHCIDKLRASPSRVAVALPEKVVPGADTIFERSWAEIVVTEAADRVQRQYASEGRDKHLRLLAVFLDAARGFTTQVDDRQLSAELKIKPHSLRSMRQNVKAQLVARMRDVVGEYAEDQRGIDDELDELRARLMPKDTADDSA
ncbi:MAG: hypothetical protein AAGI54_04070 [Planctomycetota bacterium]